jgi:hypothetical protein
MRRSAVTGRDRRRGIVSLAARHGRHPAHRAVDRAQARREDTEAIARLVNADLSALLETLDPKARDDLRRVLIRDQADRDAIASRLMPYRDQNGQDWADIIDFLTMWPDARRQVARLLGEVEAE